ncbi:MAG: hypothetical protein AAGK00_06105 [Pseudomonadota bacterium]
MGEIPKTSTQAKRASAPIEQAVAAVARLRPDLLALQERIGLLKSQMALAQNAVDPAHARLQSLLRAGRWAALVIGPWLVLSYLCWGYLRLRKWREMLWGTTR